MSSLLGGNKNKRILLEGIGSFWVRFFKDISRLTAYDSALLNKYGILYKKLLGTLMMGNLEACPLYELDEWAPIELTSVGRPLRMSMESQEKEEGVEIYRDTFCALSLVTSPFRLKWVVLQNSYFKLGAGDSSFKLLRLSTSNEIIEVAKTNEYVAGDFYEAGDYGYLNFDRNIAVFEAGDWIEPGILQYEMGIDFTLPASLYSFAQDGELPRPYKLEYWYPFKMDANIMELPLITNKLLFPEVILEKDIDFKLYEHKDSRGNFLAKYILMKEDITQNPYFASSTSDGSFRVGAWCSEIARDASYLQELYGRILGKIRPTSESYREFLRGITFMFLHGPEIKAMESGANLILGLPVVKSDGETVMSITTEFGEQVVYTDRGRYSYTLDAKIVVTEGQEVDAFQSLGSAVEIHDYLTKPGWWENLSIKEMQAPGLPLEERRMVPGSVAYELFDYILKYHTFFVEAEYGAVLRPENFSELIDTFIDIKPKWTTLYMRISMTLEDLINLLEDLRFEISSVIDEAVFQSHVFGPVGDGFMIPKEDYFKYGGKWMGLTYLTGWGTYGDVVAEHKYGMESLTWDEVVEYGQPAVSYNGLNFYGFVPGVEKRPFMTWYGDPRAKYQAKYIFKFDGEIPANGIYDFGHINLYKEPVTRLVSRVRYDGSIRLDYEGLDDITMEISTEFVDYLLQDFLKFNGIQAYSGYSEGSLVSFPAAGVHDVNLPVFTIGEDIGYDVWEPVFRNPDTGVEVQIFATLSKFRVRIVGASGIGNRMPEKLVLGNQIITIANNTPFPLQDGVELDLLPYYPDYTDAVTLVYNGAIRFNQQQGFSEDLILNIEEA